MSCFTIVFNPLYGVTSAPNPSNSPESCNYEKSMKSEWVVMVIDEYNTEGKLRSAAWCDWYFGNSARTIFTHYEYTKIVELNIRHTEGNFETLNGVYLQILRIHLITFSRGMGMVYYIVRVDMTWAVTNIRDCSVMMYRTNCLLGWFISMQFARVMSS